jgi:protoheme IX farnesyltransferase
VTSVRVTADIGRPGIAEWIALTKPRIIELLLVTTVPGMAMAAHGVPAVGVAAATIAGGTLAAGGANALNMALDADIDARMVRTRGRPAPTGAIRPIAAARFGLALNIVAFALLAFAANLLTALLVAAATVHYVVVYTWWLKRRSPHNIVIGGIAGAVPVLAGYAAVQGRLDTGALAFFALVVAWTPPHFWALAIRCVDDYRAAGVPMLPVVAGIDATTRSILRWTVIVAVLGVAVGPAAALPAWYGAGAAAAGATFLWRATRLRRDRGASAMRLLHFSIAYLFTVSSLVAAASIASA